MPAKSPIHSQHYPDSFYLATANDLFEHPRLTENINADVCIIGGGFSGINTAIELRQRGYSVVLLEAKRIGWGASGRNGGELIRGIGHDASQFKNEIGEQGVNAIEQMGFEAVDIVIERINEHHIDCDLHMGYCDLAVKPRHMDDLAEEFHELQRQGYQKPIKLLDRSQIGEVIGSDFYQGALVDMGSGHLHPLNLALGEARVARELGAQLFEYSPAEKIVKGDKPRVITAQGQVTCDYIVIAGNGYIGHSLSPYLGGKVLPTGTYLLATEPLTPQQCASIIPQNMAFADMRVALDYFHLSADRRLLFGGLCTYSGKDPKDIEAALRPNLEKVFPQLKGIRIDYEWGGMMGIGANRMPQIGRIKDSNVLYISGYSGHGVAPTHMTGRILAEAVDGDTHRFDIMNKMFHLPWPGGKLLRRPAMAVGMMWYKMLDAL